MSRCLRSLSVIVAASMAGAALVSCAGDQGASDRDAGPESGTDAPTSSPSVDDLAAMRLQQDDYLTTVDCSGKQGVFPKAAGTLTNQANQTTFFNIYVGFTVSGELVDISNAFTETLEHGETGGWETFTPAREADGCSVLCVDRKHPTDPNRKENCAAFANR